MKNIDDFCEKRNVSANMQEAFIAWLRSDYARKFITRSDGETTKLIVGKMRDDEVEDAWREFTTEFRKYLEN